MVDVWNGYVLMRDNIHPHPDYHSLRLVKVKLDREDNILDYTDIGPMEGLSRMDILNNLETMLRAMEGDIYNKSEIAASILKTIKVGGLNANK